MIDLIRGYGRVLTGLFFASVMIWIIVLILLPQLTMVERAIKSPKRSLDSSIAATLERDARTCISVLKNYQKDNAGQDVPATSGGLAIPSMSNMAVPSLGSTAPTDGGFRPYILQCDRASTAKQLPRDRGITALLNETYNLPLLTVNESDPITKQAETALEVAELAAALHKQLLNVEAKSIGLTFDNFRTLYQATLIPLTPELKAIDEQRFEKQFYRFAGLRFDHNGETYERIGLIILARTLGFAVMATGLALIACYPIAYKLALKTKPERFVLLFFALIIPYAIVELMRIYAWTAIIDNRGVLNTLFDWIGLVDLDEDGGIQFKRSAMTVFVVMVYTYMLFMLFPIVNVMTTLDRNQIEAARDLGASSWRIHWRVIIPHSKPGIAIGCIATFMLTAGAFSVPRIISSGLQAEWFSQTIYNKFFESENSNVGAAYSFAYTFVCFLLVALFMWFTKTRIKDFARST